MTIGLLAAKNVLRNRFRTALTVVGVAMAILAFVSLRTVISSWEQAATYAAKDRLGTRNKVSFVVPLPIKYVQQIREMDGVTGVSYMNWFGGKDPKHEHEFFATMAVDHRTVLSVYDEIDVPEEQKAAWMADSNKQGVLVGDVLAKKMGWKVGDPVTLTGTIYPKPGDWPFTITGIYTTTKKSIDRTQFWFHWDYLNDSMPAERQGKVGWLVVRVKDATAGNEVAAAIDAKFKGAGDETFTQSERALNLSFMAMFSAILSAVHIVSIVILMIMMLILGNTIAMGVRERTNEYGTLRAIGFLPRHVAMFIMGEALTIGVLGGGLGILLAIPLINMGMGKWLEENMGGLFPTFQVAGTTFAAAMVLAILLGAVASAVPAWRASKLSVTDALRRVG